MPSLASSAARARYFLAGERLLSKYRERNPPPPEQQWRTVPIAYTGKREFVAVNMPASQRITVDLIKRLVCQYYNIDKDELIGIHRAKHLVRARHVAIYLTRKHIGLSLTIIGRMFGRRDHTSILHAVRCIEARMQADPALDQEIAEIEAQLLIASQS